MKATRTLTATFAALAMIALAGCSSGDDAAHDHASHAEGAADAAASDDAHDGHAGHDHGAAVDAVPGLTKTEPSADYPLKTCVVSDEALDAMGEPMAFMYEGQEVQFCCEGCVDEFSESPAAFLEKIEAARAR